MPIYPMNRIKCSFDGCENMSHSKFLCHGHLWQIRRGEALHPLYRKKEHHPVIFTRSEPCLVEGVKGDCKVCVIGHTRKGYKRVRINNKRVAVHRLTWQRYVGPIPDGLVIDHQCRNRACCNVDHLRLVTPTVNTLENSNSFSAVNKRKTHCPKGHEYTEENIKSVNGGRACRICVRRMNKEYKKRKKLADAQAEGVQ